MLPTCYQNVLRSHLSESQYLTLQLLIVLLQSHRHVQLARLASVFPQPIHYSSRIRNLQRFLVLPQLNVRLLWFPIIKYWLSQSFKRRHHNRQTRRSHTKLKHTINGYLVIAVDRTQWQQRNLIMVTIIWGKHALPLYWELLDKLGSSSLKQTAAAFAPKSIDTVEVLPVVVLADREFHSPKLAQWLSGRRVDFALRQKKSAYIQIGSDEHQSLKTMGFAPADKGFWPDVYCGQRDQLGAFNLAFYWRRQYRGQGGKDPWFILTSLPMLQLALSLYCCRWGGEWHTTPTD